MAVGLLLAVGLVGCLRLSVRRERFGEPIPAHRFAELRAGEARLGDALAQVGAPLRVFPLAGGGIGMAYAWSDRLRFDGSIAYTVSELSPAISASVGDEDLDIEGWVLFFAPDDVLTRIQRGSLGALIPGVRDRTLPIPN